MESAKGKWSFTICGLRKLYQRLKSQKGKGAGMKSLIKRKKASLGNGYTGFLWIKILYGDVLL